MAFKDPEAKQAYDREYIQLPHAKRRRQAYYQQWSAKNKERLLAREAERRLKKRGQCLVSNCRTRARRKHLVFDLDQHVDEIQARIDSGYCEMTGCAFNLSPGRSWDSPSIDRIDPAAGYIYSNIRIICHAMNAAMGDWGEAPLEQMLRSWQSMPSKRGRS